MRVTHSSLVCWRRLATGFCLLAWLQAAGFVPTFLAFAASLEGSHEVSVAWGHEKVSVVLHHENLLGSAQHQHRHGAASKVLCSLGKSAPSSRPDHVVSFTGYFACEESTRESGVELSGEFVSAVLLPPLFNSSPEVLPPSAPADVTLSVAMDSTPLRALRTTVLLI